MTDYYRDTEDRMRNDADFAQAVQMFEHLARLHGFTPGELKQIAFRAALELEMKSCSTYAMGGNQFHPVCAKCRKELNGILTRHHGRDGRVYCSLICWEASA